MLSHTACCILHSGSSLTQGTTPQLMPTTRQYLAFLEGYMFLHSVCVNRSIKPLLRCSTHKIVGISTIAQIEHPVAQTQELACTKCVLPQVIACGLCLTLIIIFTPLTVLLCVQVCESLRLLTISSNRCPNMWLMRASLTRMIRGMVSVMIFVPSMHMCSEG